MLGRIIVVALLAVASFGCRKPDIWENVPGGPVKVLVSFPPLYCFAKKVGGDDVKVHSILTTQGPHDYQATADQALLARYADVLLYNGLELDDFVKKIANASGNRDLIMEPVAAAIPKDMLLKMEGGHHHHGHEGHDHHHHGEFDPHVWLGTAQAIVMVERVRDTLQKADPAHKDAYAQRAAAYIDEIKELEKYGKDALKDKKNRKLVTMHESLGYFGKSFDLDIVGSIQTRPNVEPDQRTLASLIELCEAKNARVIAIEPQYRAGPAETLRNALDRRGGKAVLVTIDPLETAESRQLNADIYVNVMKKNIDNLAKGLP